MLTSEPLSRADEGLEWEERILARFPEFCRHPFGDRHREFWEWRDSIGEERPRPFVAIWPRGGAKSTSAEMFVCDAGLSMLRPYAIYVSETQDQADKHVASIATMFERAGAERALNPYGNSKGWRRNRLSVNNGFTVDSLGFDTAARGIKIDENRPGIMVFDDVDGKHDKSRTVRKKIEVFTDTLLPAMAENCAVLFVQNLIHKRSIATRLSNMVPSLKADFLVDRIVSGPHKAIEGLETEVAYDASFGANRTLIKGGEPTWPGQGFLACQNAIDTYGLAAFLRESQHEVFNNRGTYIRQDRIEIVDSIPKDGLRVRRWDEAATEGGGDWTVGVLIARVGNTYFVEDVVRAQHGPANRDALQRRTAEVDFQKYGVTVRQVGVQDPGSAGVDRTRAFKQLMAGFAVDVERETGDKKLRADGFAREVELGNVKVLRGDWNDSFLLELEQFTGEAGGTDDQVDAASGAFNRLSKKRDIQGSVR